MKEIEKMIGEDPKSAAICFVAVVGISLCTSIMEHNYKGKIKIGSFVDIELEPAS